MLTAKLSQAGFLTGGRLRKAFEMFFAIEIPGLRIGQQDSQYWITILLQMVIGCTSTEFQLGQWSKRGNITTSTQSLISTWEGGTVIQISQSLQL